MINPINGLPNFFADKLESLSSEKKLTANNGDATALSDVSILSATKADKINTSEKEPNSLSELRFDSNKINYNEISDKLSEILGDENIDIKFSKDNDTEKMIMKIYNKDTEEIIKQFPPEITLKIAKIVSSLLEKGSFADLRV